jgi:hypothetical protein
MSDERRLSNVSAAEYSALRNNLTGLFEKYKENGGINANGLTTFAADCGVLGSGNKKLSASDATMIFQSVKLGSRTELDFDRFQEAVRKMAMQCSLTYQELIQTATGEAHTLNICILLVTAMPVNTIVEGEHESIKNILTGHGINWVEVDGSDMAQRERRNQLFGISGKKGLYPQVFIKEAGGSTKFIGDFQMVQDMNECSQLPAETIAANPEMPVFEKSFKMVIPGNKKQVGHRLSLNFSMTAAADAPAPGPAPTSWGDAAPAPAPTARKSMMFNVEASSDSGNSRYGADVNIAAGLGDGCYLVHEENNQGTLFAVWSKTPVDSCIGFFRPGKAVQGFKYANGGKKEIIRQVNGGVNIKKYFQGWVEFLKMAREAEGDLVMLKDEGASIFFNGDNHMITKCTPGEWYHASEFGEAGAVMPNATMVFQVQQMDRSMFTNKGNREGGVAIMFANSTVAGRTGPKPEALPVPKYVHEVARRASANVPRMSVKPPTAAPTVAAAAVEASSKWVKVNDKSVELGPGCYLLHDEQGAGALIINWSQVPIDEAVAYFKPGRGAKVGNFMYTSNGGRSELQRDVNGDSSNHTRFQNYCRGWTRYFQQAKEKFACVTVLKCNAGIWTNRSDVNAEYTLGTPIDFDEDKGWTSNDAIGKMQSCNCPCEFD